MRCGGKVVKKLSFERKIIVTSFIFEEFLGEEYL